MGPAMIYLKASAKLVQTFEYRNSLRYFLLFLFFGVQIRIVNIHHIDLSTIFVAKFFQAKTFNYFFDIYANILLLNYVRNRQIYWYK